MRSVLKIHKKGIVILPKKIRELIGVDEGDDVIVEVVGEQIVMRPLRPRVVDVDVRLVEALLREEYSLEKQRYMRMVSGGKTGS